MSNDKCPVCDAPYDKRISLSSRHGKTINVTGATKICQDAERRTSGGPVAGHKSTRSSSERYKFIGYLHK